jgi:hypothetical protein
MRDPKPYARFEYDINPEAVPGSMPNSSAQTVMYTEGPRSVAFPRKE